MTSTMKPGTITGTMKPGTITGTITGTMKPRTHGVRPALRGGDDIKARRDAALERLRRDDHDAPGRRGTHRAKPTRRVVRPPAPRLVEQLGPPPGVYYVIAVIVAMFVMLGLVMVLSTTSARNVGSSASPYAIFNRQFAWALIGLVGMVVAMRVPYQRWRTLVVPGAVLAAGAMMLPFVPGLGATINDANSWVRFGTYGFQPSELLKLASIAFLADLFARRRDELHLPGQGLWPMALVALGGAGVSFLQGDLGAAIVLAAIVLAVGLIAGVPFLHVGLVSVVGVAFAGLAVVSDPRRFNRLAAFRDIEGNKEHLAWQSWQGLLSIANGGITGSGIGGSNSKLGYLPLAHSDFIFAVIADELGFIGSFAVIGGFALLVWFGIQTALAAPDQFGLILAGGIAAWFGVQAIINMGGVVGLMPVTGLTLPFFSAGGTSLCVSMVAAGLLLNVARRAVTAPSGGRRNRVPAAPRTPSRSR
ncbi:MAG TPA: putative peptidoglycan glycosyltransferase FtsW [Ilumatobacter sp.]